MAGDHDAERGSRVVPEGTGGELRLVAARDEVAQMLKNAGVGEVGVVILLGDREVEERVRGVVDSACAVVLILVPDQLVLKRPIERPRIAPGEDRVTDGLARAVFLGIRPFVDRHTVLGRLNSGEDDALAVANLGRGNHFSVHAEGESNLHLHQLVYVQCFSDILSIHGCSPFPNDS